MPDLLVIGCGTNIHAAHIMGWNEVSIDINGASFPTHIWDITNPVHVNQLTNTYPAHFDVVYFENIPAQVFNDRNTRVMIMNALDQVLVAGGDVRLRTGVAGEQNVKRLKAEFFVWGYQIAEVPRPMAALVQNLDLATDDVDDPFDITFTKAVGSRRRAAEV